jgi:hypothetical protein
MRPSVLDRAHQDAEAGRLWKARERLEGSLANDATNVEVLHLLGEICHRMGDLPAAGAYWFLTERSGPDVTAATAALRERFPTPAALFAALPVKAPLDDYPDEVRIRLERLVADDSVRWLFAKKLEGLGRKGRDDPRAANGGATGWAVAGAVVAPWLVGIAAIGYALVRLLRRLW